MMTSRQDARVPPVVSYQSFQRLLRRLGEAQPLPRPMDSAFWRRMKFSGSLTSALKSAFAYLGLIEPDGTPTADLDALMDAEGAEQDKVLGGIFARAYGPVLARLELERATAKQLKDEFAALGASREANWKAVSFFLAMAGEAGHPVHPHLLVQMPRTAQVSRGLRRASPAGRRQPGAGSERWNFARSVSAAERGGAPQLENLHSSLAGLLSTMPPAGQGWDRGSKERFKQAFEALLDVLYPDPRGG